MKRARQLLWTLNGLLALGILVFGARYLVFPPGIDHLADIDPDAALPSPPRPPRPPPNEDVLRTLPNPLGVPKERSLTAASSISLHGSLPTMNGEQGVAFIRTDRNVSVVVPIGEEVQGWRLEELWKDRATFTNSRGERRELQIAR